MGHGTLIIQSAVRRSQIQEQPGMAAVLAALCPNLHRDLGLSSGSDEVLPQVMQQLRNMQ